MLTVIIPVYNVAAYLENCLDSVINQTYSNLEIILINDGSTDLSGDICRRYADSDSRILYIEKKNGGSASARNLGIETARGNYLTFLDADDWWDYSYAEKMIPYMELADIVVCDLEYVSIQEGVQSGRPSKIRMPDRIPQRVSENRDLINRSRTFLCGKIFKTEMFRKYKIVQPDLPINDIPIVPLLTALSEKVCRVGEPLYHYLKNRAGNTISSVEALKSFGDALLLMRRNFEKFQLAQNFDQALKKMYFSQVRFSIRKAKEALISKKIDSLQYEAVEGYLIGIISNFWEKWPDIRKIKFCSSTDTDVNHAISNILFDDSALVDKEPFDYRVAVIKEGDKSDSSCKAQQQIPCRKSKNVIWIRKDSNLFGEDLWWQMADDLLFAL